MKLEKSVVAFMATVHLAALALCALFPSWQGVAVMAVLYLATGLGVTAGYHRLLTHRSFRADPWVYRTLAVLGLLSGEGPPLFWVAHHRRHHELSDQPGDPHRPADGFWWAHWLWLFPRLDRPALGALYRRYAPDLARNPFCARLETGYLGWHLALAGLLLAGGFLSGGPRMAMSWLAYGFFLRMVLVLHATWMVNSVTHTWGTQAYDTGDESRNNGLVAAVSLGEGWHNNHHHAQAAANHGHGWWQPDATFLAILAAAAVSRVLSRLTGGRVCPVRDVRVYRHGRMETWFGS